MRATVDRKKERKKAAYDKAIIMRDSSSAGSSSLFFFCLQHKPGRFAVLPTDQHEDKEVESLQERADTLMHTCPTVLVVAGAFTSVSTGTSSVRCRGLLMKMLKIRQN